MSPLTNPGRFSLWYHRARHECPGSKLQSLGGYLVEEQRVQIRLFLPCGRCCSRQCPLLKDPDVETTALEAKIRQELSLLRSRLLELETLLDLLQAGSGAAEVDPVQDSGKAAVGEAVPPTPKPVVSGLRDQELSSGVVSSGGQAISVHRLA